MYHYLALSGLKLVLQGDKLPALQQIPFAISSGNAYSNRNNNSKLLNLYVQMSEAGSKTNHILLNTSGAELISEVEYTIRGVYEFQDRVFVATEKKLLEYDIVNDTFIELGDVLLQKKVYFADNGINIMIVGGNGYAYTPSTGKLKNMETEAGWYPADMVSYLDGYFIFNRTGTGQFFISKLFSTEINPIDWATAEAAPDDTVGIIVAARQLWIFGERTAEIWYDSGDPDFPLTRISGAAIDIGCANYQSIAKIRESVLFVSIDNKVYMTQGYAPTIISNPAIEKDLQEAQRGQVSAFSYTENGSWFYCLTIDNNKTWVYDPDTKQWHNRESGSLGKWFIDGAVNIYSTGQVLAYSDNGFYSLSINTLTENGNPIKREAVTLPVNKTVNRIRIHEVQLDMEVAFNTKAEIILQLSEDSGATWKNNIVTYTGSIGQRKTRARWMRLGQTRDAIMRIRTFDAIPIRINGLWARIT